MANARIDPWLAKYLACPRDYHPLSEPEPGVLQCPEGHTYPVIDGITVMLRSDVLPTHGVFLTTLQQAAAHVSGTRETIPEPLPGAIDPFVQKEIAATCGNLYTPLINRLTHYPIPEIRLPEGKGDALLDIGCNWGRWCVSAARKGYRAIGIDPSLEALRAARRVAQQNGIHAIYVAADSRHLPFAPASFDVVFSYSVLQHLERDDVRQTLQAIKRVLRPGGKSLIQMPNRYGFLNAFYQIRQLFRPHVFFDVHYWLPTRLQSLFSREIGPTTLLVDGFFSLNPQKTDLDLLPPFSRCVVSCSEFLRRLSETIPPLKFLADSLYVQSNRP